MSRSLRNLALLAVALMAVAAVSAAAGGPTRTHAGEFKIMVITGINTTINNNPTVPGAVQVAAADVNAHGGLGGKQIVVSTCNHQGNATGQQACARQAVADGVDDVFIYGQFTTASTPILNAAKIPMIGSYVANAFDTQQPAFIALTAGSASQWGCVPYLLKKLGVKKMSMLGFDVANVYNLNNILKVSARGAHVRYQGDIYVPVTTSDYTPYVQRAKELGAEGIGMGITVPPAFQLLRAEQALGLNIPNVTTAGSTTDNDLKSFGGLENGRLYGCLFVPPPSATNIPAVKKFNQQMDAGGFGSKGPNTLQAWLSVYALQGLAKLVKGEVTGPKLLAKAHTAKNINVQGVINWSPGARGPAAFPYASNGREWFWQAKDGFWQLYGGTKPIDVWKLMGIARK